MVLKPAIASMSLGRAWLHDFHKKAEQASEAGFGGMEVFYEDLEYVARTYAETKLSDGAQEVDERCLLLAAKEIRQSCDHFGLTIIGLQPFLFYEGLLDRKEHSARIRKLRTWFKIVKILGTDLIQIPSNFQPTGISGDIDLIVRDMIEIADLGLQESPPVRFAYENLAWGTFVYTWEVLWDVVRRVERANFGCCLDTFNIAGGIWADPTSPSGKMPDADAVLRNSLEALVKTVELDKVFYIQVIDAERMKEPLVEGHPFYVEGQPPRMSWSRNARVFPFEIDRGAYLPVVEVARAFVHGLGYKGWVSMELFSRTMSDPDLEVPRSHSMRGFNSWQKLVEELCPSAP